MEKPHPLTQWAINKIKAEYKDDIALLIAVTGHATDGDSHGEVFDYFIPETERGYQLSRTFLLDGIGHDLYPRSWERMEKSITLDEMTIVLANGNILYANHEESADRFLAMQKQLTENLNNPEFVVIMNGRQQYVVDDKHYMLYRGDIFMTYPYENHGNGNRPQEVCEFIWFQFDLSSAKDFLGLSPRYGQYLFQQLLNYRHRTKKACSKELSLLLQAFQCLSSSRIQEQIVGYSCFLQFVMNNICTDDIPMTRELYSPDIQEALTYIHAHLTEDLSIERISQFCGLSPSRFKAKFKEELGITPHADIISLKIDTSKVLLKNPDVSVTDIAFRLNFASSNYFASVFKKHTGYTPTDFRQQRFSHIY